MHRLFGRKLRRRWISNDVGETKDESPENAALQEGPPAQKSFPVGIKELYSSQSSVVDIVFVHGLTGDRERTWALENQEPWPKTLLPTELPNVRVLTFGYDANVVDLGGVVSENRIGNHAMNLITALASYREKDDIHERPIIFVCHSLGGLVCQDALIQARERPELHLKQIYFCCRGIIFLGTPHRGAGLAKWGEMLARALGLIKQTNKRILDVLKRDSEVLARVQDGFFTMIRSRNQEKLPPVEITCFFEELPLPGIGVVVPQESARVPGYIPISIHQNHMNMTKFANDEDPGFTAVVGELRRWIRQIADPVPKSAESPKSLTVSERDFLASIGPRRYIDIDDRVQGTCTWSVETAQYHSWLYGEQSSVLWVTGGAGSGKTTLTNYLVEHLKEQYDSTYGYHIEHVVCSFFCSRDVEGLHDGRSLLRDLVLQLAESRKKVIRQIKATYGAVKREYDSSFEDMWRTFEKVLLILPCQCIYITIDALDECDAELGSRLFRKFARTASSLAGSQLTKLKKVKMIISGQPQIRASWSFPSESVEHHHINMEDRSAGMMRDIYLFVDTRVAELVKGGICSQSAGQYLRGRLMSMAENSFLWLDMVLKHIQRGLGYRVADLERILSNTPEDLQQAYTKYLPSFPAEEVAILQRYLRVLVVSSRPLSLVEIHVLTATHEEDRESKLPMTADYENAIRGSIQRALGPLVRFPHGTAQFVHSTAREFFLLLGQQPLHPLCNSHGVDPAEAHFFCARSCMTYLLDQSIPEDLFNIERLDSPSLDTQSPISDRPRTDDEDMFTSLFDIGEARFLRDEESLGSESCLDIQRHYQAYDYAANNWTYHFARTGSMSDNQFLSMGLDLVSCVAGRSSNWYKYRAYQSYLQMPSFGDSSPIVLAAMFDLSKIVQVLLNNSGHLQTPQMLFSALFWAASRGSYAAVKLLLEHGVPVSSVDTRNVPLAVATRGNYKEICNLLLEASDVNPNEQDSHGKPALVLAAEADHVQILRRILLHKSIRVDQADTDGRTALIAASRSGSVECVRILREDGRANINCTDHKGQTSLHHASSAGHLSTLKELLSFAGLDLHVKDRAGRNAISLASQQGHLDVVRFLHHRKVDATSTDLHGRNSISWAANNIKATESIDDSKESVLEYLVRKFPDAADAPDESGWSPLAWAVDTPGYLKSVQILLRCPSVDVNRRDEGGSCLLQWAASSDMKDIVKCLLERSDIDVNCASNGGWTALFTAASNGKMESLKLILQHKDVDVHHRDRRGTTAADWARFNNHVEILDLLRSYA